MQHPRTLAQKRDRSWEQGSLSQIQDTRKAKRARLTSQPNPLSTTPSYDPHSHTAVKSDAFLHRSLEYERLPCVEFQQELWSRQDSLHAALISLQDEIDLSHQEIVRNRRAANHYRAARDVYMEATNTYVKRHEQARKMLEAEKRVDSESEDTLLGPSLANVRDYTNKAIMKLQEQGSRLDDKTQELQSKLHKLQEDRTRLDFLNMAALREPSPQIPLGLDRLYRLCKDEKGRALVKKAIDRAGQVEKYNELLRATLAARCEAEAKYFQAIVQRENSKLRLNMSERAAEAMPKQQECSAVFLQNDRLLQEHLEYGNRLLRDDIHHRRSLRRRSRTTVPPVTEEVHIPQFPLKDSTRPVDAHAKVGQLLPLIVQRVNIAAAARSGDQDPLYRWCSCGRERRKILLPCSHTCCVVCSDEIRNANEPRCPVCMKPVTKADMHEMRF